MQHEPIRLPVDYAAHGIKAPKSVCTLLPYAPPVYDESIDILRPAVIIFPGGAYRKLSAREGEPAATEFLAAGFSAFILRYTVADDGYFPCALIEAFEAVRYVREHANEYHIDPNRIWLLGFSAGGHAAAAAGVLWNHSFVRALGYEGEMHRPDGMILCYPVITSGTYAHRDSFRNLLGRQYDEELLKLNSLELQVNRETPPTFLWHTATDRSVPVQNSLLFANALIAAGVETELHVYPRGDHALSTARFDVLTPKWYHDPDPYILASVPTWTRAAIRFLNAAR